MRLMTMTSTQMWARRAVAELLRRLQALLAKGVKL